MKPFRFCNSHTQRFMAARPFRRTVRDIRLLAPLSARPPALCLLLPARKAPGRTLFLTKIAHSAITVRRGGEVALHLGKETEYYRTRPGLLADLLLRTMHAEAGRKKFVALYESVLLRREQEEARYYRTHPTATLRLLRQTVWLAPRAELYVRGVAPAAQAMPTPEENRAHIPPVPPPQVEADAAHTEELAQAVLRRVEKQLKAENLRRGRG